jgi:hypothetical protein
MFLFSFFYENKSITFGPFAKLSMKKFPNKKPLFTGVYDHFTVLSSIFLEGLC